MTTGHHRSAGHHHAIERMDHFPSEELLAHREPSFAALQMWLAEAAGENLLLAVPPLAELRFDVGRQVVGLVSAEALFSGALAAASVTRRRGGLLPDRIPVSFEHLHALAESTLAQGPGTLDDPDLTSLVDFAAGRLAAAACRTDPRLSAEGPALVAAARVHVELGVATELELAKVHGIV
jgi:hypothetical protein